jgi:hypothetical protein
MGEDGSTSRNCLTSRRLDAGGLSATRNALFEDRRREAGGSSTNLAPSSSRRRHDSVVVEDMSLRTAFRVIVAVAAVLLAGPQCCRAIEIGEVRWGFDGQITRHHFVPLSVLIVNPGAEPFDGVIGLHEQIGAGTPVGAALVEEVYVAPQSSRWVQFYPFVKETFEEWSLQWGRRSGERAEVNAPTFVPATLADPKPILLVDADDFSTKGHGLRRFPENLFPPFVAATDGLKTAVLDHAPRWEDARRQAFYDWLCRGGRLHLFQGADGSFPRFTAQLAELNTPADHFRVGSGEVFRHDKPLGPADAALLEMPSGASDKKTADKKTLGKKTPDKLFNAVAGKTAGSSKKTAPANPEDDDDGTHQVQVQVGRGGVTRRVYGNGQTDDELFPDLTAGLFAFLKSLTRPRHNWVLIYSLAVVYVITVVPGVFILGRNRYDYRIVYGVLVSLIILFSFGFAYFGRRGHNEANAINTVAVARQLPGGAWDVMSWTNVFVINGADYELVHSGTGRLYSTAQTVEAVNGVIRDGARGRFDVDIPPFSSQAFVGRMKVTDNPFDVKLQEFAAADNKLTKLTLTMGPGFPPPGYSWETYAMYGDRFYLLHWSKDRFQLDRPGDSASDFLANVDWNKISPYSMGYGNGPMVRMMRAPEAPLDDKAQYEKLVKPMLAWSLDLKSRTEIPNFRLPAETIRLFLWCPLPKSLELVGPRMGKQQGRVLYVLDFAKPVKS